MEPEKSDASEVVRFPRVMGNQDALMWRLERNPIHRSTTAAVTLLARGPDRERLVAVLERAAGEIPRLGQRVVELPRALSNPVWVADRHFDLGYHLRWIRAPRDGSLRALLDLAASFAMQGFDPSRPLWEFVVVEDLAGGRAALIQKLHHAVTDGIGGLLLMQRVYDAAPEGRADGEAPPAPPPADEVDGALRLGAEMALRKLAARPGVALRRAGRVLRSAASPLRSARGAAADLGSLARSFAPSLAPLSPVMRGRSSRYRFELMTVPVAGLRAAAHAAGCKLNDAFLAALGGGWRRYHALHGVRVEALRATIPISLRGGSAGAVAGNQLLLARIAVPVAERDPRRRMRRIRALVDAERAQPARHHMESAAGWIGRLPGALLDAFIGSLLENVDFIASCVPGPPQTLYVAGAPVEAIHPFGPPAGSAANVTLFRYREDAAVTFNLDAASVPDSAELLECMRAGFEEVLALGRCGAAARVGEPGTGPASREG